MRKFNIYSYQFKDAEVTGNLFQQQSESPNDSSEERRRKTFENLFGGKNSDFKILTNKKEINCTVIDHPEGFVLLRIDTKKLVTIWEKDDAPPGILADINKRTLPSNPYNYIVIDFRPGHNRIAIELSSAWRNLDTLARFLEGGINDQLYFLSRKFNIEIRPKVLAIDYVQHSRWLIKKKKIPVTKMTIYLTNGTINPKVEEIIKENGFLKDIIKRRMLDSDNATITYQNPNGLRILDGRTKILEHLVMLIGSEPDNFKLRMSYDDGDKVKTYTCGKDIRMDFDMNDDTFMTMLGVGNLFPETEIGPWFDDVEKEFLKQENAKEIQ